MPLHEFSDVGNANRLYDMCGEDLIHAKGLGYLVWVGTHFVRSEHLARSRAQEMVAKFIFEREIPMAADDDEKDALVKWAKDSRNSGRISSVLQELETRVHRGDDGRAVFDTNPILFNSAAGTHNLRTGETYPHRREDLLTVCVPTAPNIHHDHHRWLDMLDKMFPDAEEREHFRLSCGYWLTGLIGEKCFWVFHGPKGSAKSTLFDLFLELMGDYAQVGNENVFIKNGGSPHQTFIAELAGKRLVVLSELSPTDKLSPKIKNLTGDGTLTANFMRQDSIQFKSQMKLLVGTNYTPQVTDFGSAMKDRPRMYDLSYDFSRTGLTREDALDLLLLEAPGILAWCLQASKDYFASEGLKPTKRMVEATDAWFDMDDNVGSWISTRCDTWPIVDGSFEQYSTISQLYASFAEWWAFEKMPDRPISRKTFERDLRGRSGVAFLVSKPPTPARYGLVVKRVDTYGNVIDRQI